MESSHAGTADARQIRTPSSRLVPRRSGRPEMKLSNEACEAAWRARDPSYDGFFFIGVLSTGVYCRCVCPVRLPLRRNIEFLPSAAAAEAAGFRPCLRCRPEAAPWSPAWKGSLATVERAVRLIVDEGALDRDGTTVELLANRVGVGARHLARLFARHIGATPTQFARTARIQRAKRLLDATDLNMTEIAMLAGFGSVRRFNSTFLELYKRSPSSMRRSVR
jgi:AraC family transcriptional regulator of adaptative response/methylated-DNA-[protein]-cysteine methyltransferase